MSASNFVVPTVTKTVLDEIRTLCAIASDCRLDPVVRSVECSLCGVTDLKILAKPFGAPAMRLIIIMALSRTNAGVFSPNCPIIKIPNRVSRI